MKYLQAKHIKALVEQGGLLPIRDTAALLFYSELEGYPWTNVGLDWHKIGESSANFDNKEELSSCRKSLNGAVDQLVLVYSASEALAGEVDLVLSCLDELVWLAPGRRYLLGAILTNSELLLKRGVVLEYDGADSLRYSVGDRRPE